MTENARRLPKRPCSIPGCAELTEHGSRCPAHQRMQEDRRLQPYKRGYDADHKRLRILAFERDQWRCVDCGWQPDIVRDADLYGLEPSQADILDELRQSFNRGERHLHADHEISIEERPDLRRDLDNYRTRCNECHSRKTLSELHSESSGQSKAAVDPAQGPRAR